MKARGYDLADFPDGVKETRPQQLPLDAQIQQLQKCAERIRKILMRPASSSTTPSALLSASAPPANALATCGKHVNNPRQRQSLTGRRVSYVDPAGPKVKQHGIYKCKTPMQPRTYFKAAALAEFIYDALIKVRGMDCWNCLNRDFIASLPY